MIMHSNKFNFSLAKKVKLIAEDRKRYPSHNKNIRLP